MVIWITGLSGAGKTTIAGELTKQLREKGQPCILLDGDKIRQAVDDPGIGYDPKSRLAGAMRICRLTKMLEQEGVWLIVATMCLFKEVYQWNRENFQSYLEVYTKVDLAVLKTRNDGGLYSLAAAGDTSDVVGIHYQAQEPDAPDLVIDNNGSRSKIPEIAQKIIARVRNKKSI